MLIFVAATVAANTPTVASEAAPQNLWSFLAVAMSMASTALVSIYGPKVARSVNEATGKVDAIAEASVTNGTSGGKFGKSLDALHHKIDDLDENTRRAIASTNDRLDTHIEACHPAPVLPPAPAWDDLT